MNTKMKLGLILGWIGGSIMTGAMLVTLRAQADGDPYTDSVPRLVPYEGTLEKDGVGYDGEIDMVFALYDGANATSASWVETQTVAVYAGKFSVLLGNKSTASVTNLELVLSAGDDIYLGVSLVSDEGTVALGGKKRFVPVPYAMWAAAGTDVTVGHRLAIDSDLTANGTDGPLVIRNSTGNILTVDGNGIQTNGTLQLNTRSLEDVLIESTLQIIGNDVQVVNTANGDGGVALRHESGDRLTINAGSTYSGGTRIEGALEVETVTGLEVTVTVDTDNNNECYEYDLGLYTGTHYMVCSDGYALVGGNWQGLVNNGKALQFARCCRIKATVQ